MIEHAVEDFLDLQRERRQLDALDLHAAVHKFGDVIVVADREGEGNTAHGSVLCWRVPGERSETRDPGLIDTS